jgi:hypothetical protein
MNAHLRMNQPAIYQIQVQGRLPDHWSEVFDQWQVLVDDRSGEVITTLSGTVADQAALHGVLQALYALGLPVRTVQSDLPSTSTREAHHGHG